MQKKTTTKKNKKKKTKKNDRVGDMDAVFLQVPFCSKILKTLYPATVTRYEKTPEISRSITFEPTGAVAQLLERPLCVRFDPRSNHIREFKMVL